MVSSCSTLIDMYLYLLPDTESMQDQENHTCPFLVNRINTILYPEHIIFISRMKKLTQFTHNQLKLHYYIFLDKIWLKPWLINRIKYVGLSSFRISQQRWFIESLPIKCNEKYYIRKDISLYSYMNLIDRWYIIPFISVSKF